MYLKKQICLIGLCVTTYAAFAQQPPKKTGLHQTSKPITPIAGSTAQEQQSNPAALYAGGTEKPQNFEDYLVQLAIQNNPNVEGLNQEVSIRKEEIKVVKSDWKRNILIGYNLNESNFPYLLKNTFGIEKIFGQRIDPSRVPQVVTYPLWNAGLQFNIGDLIQRKYKVKMAEFKQKVAENEVLTKKNKIRGEVMKAWNGFRSAQEILKIRIQVLDVSEANKVQISELFSLNKAKFEEYNMANKSYFDALEGKIKAEWDIKGAKSVLEEVIGCKWESVEKIKGAYDELDKNK
jgi:outer membrane protein TolC